MRSASISMVAFFCTSAARLTVMRMHHSGTRLPGGLAPARARMMRAMVSASCAKSGCTGLPNSSANR